MKLRIYNIAAMAFIGLMAYSITGYAQEPATQPAPQANATTATGYGASGSNGGYGARSYSVAPMYAYSTSQDTVYLRKMRKLQEQQRALQKEMSDLRMEQNKKENVDRMEKMNVRLKEMNKRFDTTFSRNFSRSFSTNMRFNFNSNDDNLDKKVQSGEVKEKSKTYTKTYTADGNDKLQIDNRFGKVTVATWAKNEFKVDVQIKAYANEDADAQKLLDQTSISDHKENNLVAFKTEINDSNNNGNSWWGTMTNNGKTTVRKMVVTYTVYMPIKSAVSITNKYGLIELPALEGKVTINNTYGGLIAKSLINSDINLRYGNANIISLSGSDLNLSYGSLKLDAADKLNAVINYSPAKIGKLSSSANFTIRYGDGLEIGDMDKNLKSLSINTSYAPVKLGSLNDTNADFDVTVHNADFFYNNSSTTVTSKTPDNERGYTPTKTYKGHIGKGNADKVITIKANYGAGVKFEQ